MRPTEIIIDRLVLTDVPLEPGQAADLPAQVAGELTRLLASGDWPGSATEGAGRLEGAEISLAAAPASGQVAGQVARSVAGALRGARA
jgi:hypothetical protein